MTFFLKRQESSQLPINQQELQFINSHMDLSDDYTFQVETGSPFNISSIKSEIVTCIVNYKRVNDHRFVNKMLEAVNEKLIKGGTYICCVETLDSRRERILRKFNPLIAYPYYSVDFILKRVFPKVPILKYIYFKTTGGRNRVISLPEAMGRLYSCGFQILEKKDFGYLTWFACQKISDPVYDMNPTYGPLVKMKRVGRDKKIIEVYKMRTMHPYSEYLQEYLFDKHGTKDGDKITYDYRITTWGRLMRVFWIDELPMLINWFKGDLKLVGNRPLSVHKFYTYPEYLQDYRTKFKPGLIPPFYADMPESPEEFYKTEMNYLKAYEKAPFKTDVKYFFKAIFNIVFRNARSR